jgi:hypothetical protein
VVVVEEVVEVAVDGGGSTVVEGGSDVVDDSEVDGAAEVVEGAGAGLQAAKTMRPRRIVTLNRTWPQCRWAGSGARALGPLALPPGKARFRALIHVFHRLLASETYWRQVDMADEVEAPSDQPSPPTRGRSWLLKAAAVVIVALIVVGLTGFFRVLEAEATATGGGVEATVTYALIARRGEAVPLKITLTGVHDDGKPVTIWIRDSYLEDLEMEGWTPEPSATEADSGRLGHVFPPAAGTLNLELDARLLPTTTVGNHRLNMVIETDVGELDFLLTTLVFP